MAGGNTPHLITEPFHLAEESIKDNVNVDLSSHFESQRSHDMMSRTLGSLVGIIGGESKIHHPQDKNNASPTPYANVIKIIEKI